MAAHDLAVIHIEAGRAYLAALRQLGLDPDCLFWAEDAVVGHPVLVLVSMQFDRVGPLALSRLLFKAHNLAATPPEISPFIIRLHSPEQAFIRTMEGDGIERFISEPPTVSVSPILQGGKQPLRTEAQPATVLLTAGGLTFRPEWIYKWKIPLRKPSPVGLSRQWRRFARNVDRLAA